MSEDVVLPRPKVLCVGIVCLDILLDVDSYPLQDSKTRLLQRGRERRGGNAANTASVLAQLSGSSASLLATLPQSSSAVVLQDLDAVGVDASLCVRCENYETMPTSYIIRCRRNGSRTILHHRDLPELTLGDLPDAVAALRAFSWFHFEGRNTDVTRAMCQRVRDVNGEQSRISIEIERRDAAMARVLVPYADVLIFSSDFVRFSGFDEAKAFIAFARRELGAAADAIIVCPWGAQGVYASEADELIFCPAAPVAQVVDSTGAGDAFNAALIFALHERRRPLRPALEFACRIAAQKVASDAWDIFGACSLC